MRLRASFLMAGLLGLAAAPAAQENRAWWVELELQGPLASVELDCGEEGRTHLAAGLVRGEHLLVSVPVPRRVPLGLEGLAAAGLPTARAQGAGVVGVLGWASEQPSTRVTRLVRLLARPRPPAEAPGDGLAGDGGGLPGLASLGLALACFFVAFALRRRPRASLGAGVLGAAGLLGLSVLDQRGSGEPRELVLIEGEAGTPDGLALRAGRDALRLAAASALEVRPAGRALEFELELRDGRLTGFARARGAELYALEIEPTPALERERNAFAALDSVWVRSAGGAWEARGPWPLGGPLPPAEGTGRPPGWLVAGLPPGRSVLVGRSTGESGPGSGASRAGLGAGTGAWVRLVGFQERD